MITGDQSYPFYTWPVEPWGKIALFARNVQRRLLNSDSRYLEVNGTNIGSSAVDETNRNNMNHWFFGFSNFGFPSTYAAACSWSWSYADSLMRRRTLAERIIILAIAAKTVSPIASFPFQKNALHSRIARIARYSLTKGMLIITSTLQPFLRKHQNMVQQLKDIWSFSWRHLLCLIQF